MTHIRLSDLRNGYVKVVRWVLVNGNPVAVRDLRTYEQTGVTITFDDPTAVLLPIGVGRRINTKLAAVEALQIMAGVADASLIERAAPGYADVLVDPNDPDYGSYGARLRYQLSNVYATLASDPTTRRAVAAIWHPNDLTHDGDRPCTLSLQFLIRDGRLEMHVNMRSQDVWLGLPYDVFMFSQVQLSLAQQLNVQVGKYVHHVGSMHLYERDVAGADALHDVLSHEPIAYPTGIVSSSHEDTFIDVATYLLEGSANQDERKLNDWYVVQLDKINLSQVSDT